MFSACRVAMEGKGDNLPPPSYGNGAVMSLRLHSRVPVLRFVPGQLAELSDVIMGSALGYSISCFTVLQQ
jgi:hypothetical protein